MDLSTVQKIKDLPLVLGYEHLEKQLGRDKRTIQMWIAAGKFPKPMDLGKGKRGWALQDVLDWYDQGRKGLIASAVANPASIKANQVADAIAELGARLAGVDKSEVLGVTVKMTPEQHTEAVEHAKLHTQRIVGDLAASLKVVHLVEALILVRALLPKPLPEIADGMLHKLLGKPIEMSETDWLAVATEIVGCLVDGVGAKPSTHPTEVVDALIANGVLKAK